MFAWTAYAIPSGRYPFSPEPLSSEIRCGLLGGHPSTCEGGATPGSQRASSRNSVRRPWLRSSTRLRASAPA
eukprot:5583777-Alexandrium_andersonii.AAC.1